MDLAPNEETREILRRAPQIRQDFLERQRGEAGPANVLANIAAAEPANVVTAIGAMAEAVATTALAAVQPRVRELEARVSALEAELTEERSAQAAERERLGVDTCSCCQDRGAETRFLDCGHSCACEQCAAKIRDQGDPCPLCRAEIREVATLRNLSESEARVSALEAELAEERDARTAEREGGGAGEPSKPPRRRQRRR